MYIRLTRNRIRKLFGGVVGEGGALELVPNVSPLSSVDEMNSE